MVKFQYFRDSVLPLLLILGQGSNAQEGECNESGYEVWQSQDNGNVDLKLVSNVDFDTCTYKLSISFKPDPNLAFLNDVTADDFLGVNKNPDYNAICDAEGRSNSEGLEDTPIASGHVGLNKNYTDFAYSVDVPSFSAKSIGFKLATVGAGPCGTALQPFPQYSVHFYNIDVEGRRAIRCNSDGGYFCKSQAEQCSDAGRKMNLDGVGLETCPDAPPGPPMFKNVPPNYVWTLDNNPLNGVNAGSPGMGLHSVDVTEFGDPTRSQKIPYLLMLNYDRKIVGNHVLFWSGYTIGETNSSVYEKATPEYNCHNKTEYGYLPTNTRVEYDEATGRTATTISGPLSDCSGGTGTVTETVEYGTGKFRIKIPFERLCITARPYFRIETCDAENPFQYFYVDTLGQIVLDDDKYDEKFCIGRNGRELILTVCPSSSIPSTQFYKGFDGSIIGEVDGELMAISYNYFTEKLSMKPFHKEWLQQWNFEYVYETTVFSESDGR